MVGSATGDASPQHRAQLRRNVEQLLPAASASAPAVAGREHATPGRRMRAARRSAIADDDRAEPSAIGLSSTTNPWVSKV
jgi:hypothetical protein